MPSFNQCCLTNVSWAILEYQRNWKETSKFHVLTLAYHVGTWKRWNMVANCCFLWPFHIWCLKLATKSFVVSNMCKWAYSLGGHTSCLCTICLLNTQQWQVFFLLTFFFYVLQGYKYGFLTNFPFYTLHCRLNNGHVQFHHHHLVTS